MVKIPFKPAKKIDGGTAIPKIAAAAAARVPLEAEDMPLLGGGDHSVFANTSFFHDFGRSLLFNLVGGLLPQRSAARRRAG